MSETISVHNMFSPGLSLEFSCIEHVIQWKKCIVQPYTEIKFTTTTTTYCGSVDAKIRASDKDLPVPT